MTPTPSTVVCYVYTNPDTGEQTHYRPADITVVTLHAGGSNIEGAATGDTPTTEDYRCVTCGHATHTCVTAESARSAQQTT